MTQEVSNEKSALFPLESNPETLNYFLNLIGFDVQKYRFVDVFSTSDQDLLNLVPRPVLGLLLVRPSRDSKITDSGVSYSDVNMAKIRHVSQTIGGTCGSLAVLHLIANLNLPSVSDEPLCRPNSWVERFLTSDEAHLDEEFCRLHNEAACHQSNQTTHAKLIPGKRVGTTFSAFVPIQLRHHGDQDSTFLVELDGRKQGPIIHGRVAALTFLEDSCCWIEKDLLKSQPDGKFAILALAACFSSNE